MPRREITDVFSDPAARRELFLYMYITGKEDDLLVAELRAKLGTRTDGGGRNLIARCPFCGKESKFGVYIKRNEGELIVIKRE